MSEKVISPWCSPQWSVLEPNGTFRCCRTSSQSSQRQRFAREPILEWAILSSADEVGFALFGILSSSGCPLSTPPHQPLNILFTTYWKVLKKREGIDPLTMLAHAPPYQVLICDVFVAAIAVKVGPENCTVKHFVKFLLPLRHHYLTF